MGKGKDEQRTSNGSAVSTNGTSTPNGNGNQSKSVTNSGDGHINGNNNASSNGHTNGEKGPGESDHMRMNKMGLEDTQDNHDAITLKRKRESSNPLEQ